MDNLLAILLENRMTLLLLLGVVLAGLVLLQRRKQGAAGAPETPAAKASSQTAAVRGGAPGKAAAPEPAPAVTEPILDDLGEDAHPGASFDVVEADPMEEAQIFLQYGYYDRAAGVLRWLADKSETPDPRALRLLLEVYLRLERIDDCADILERLVTASGTDAALQQTLLAGLKVDPENLPLRVLAMNHFGLGVEEVNALIGFESPQAMPVMEEAAAAPPAPRAPMPAAARPGAPAAPARPRHPLLTGHAPLAPLSPDEKLVVCAFLRPAQEAKLHLLSGNHAGALQAFQRAIAAQPKALVHYTELLKIHQARRDAGAYARTLWQLYAVLGGAGLALRERLLAAGFALGHHPALEALAQSRDPGHIEAIGQRFGYLAKDTAPRRRLQIVDASQASGGIRSIDQHDDVLLEAESYIEYGQVEHALVRLEEAILADPAAVHLYPTLLELYDRMDDLARFSAFVARIKQLAQRPPEEVVAMLSSLYQRFKDRTEKIAA